MGEWGGFMDGGKNEQWMTYLRDFMIENRIHHTFWCFNENSGDTGGLVYDNFGKWDEEKYALVKPALWQDDNGKFISLDHNCSGCQRHFPFRLLRQREQQYNSTGQQNNCR